MQRSRSWMLRCLVLLGLTFATAAIAQTNKFPATGSVGIGTTNPQAALDVQGDISILNYGHVSSYRDPVNNYTNIFLGGGIKDNANGTFTTITDGGSNYFGAIRMDGTGWPAGVINFYTGSSTGGSAYSLTNAQLANYVRMSIVGSNVGIGTTNPEATLEVKGNVKLTSGSGASITFSDGTTQSTAWSGTLCGGDYAESVDVTGERTQYEPGDVMVVDSDHPGHFLKASERYSTLVAGIYSTKPGMIGRRQTVDPKLASTEIPMAMVGVVPTKVTAENGPIHPGDILVTSSVSGTAMKGTDRSLFAGAIVGKALGSLDSGTAVIEVLVSLQ